MFRIGIYGKISLMADKRTRMIFRATWIDISANGVDDLFLSAKRIVMNDKRWKAYKASVRNCKAQWHIVEKFGLCQWKMWGTKEMRN